MDRFVRFLAKRLLISKFQLNGQMATLSLQHIALIYLTVVNVVTFFVYGIDKWRSTSGRLLPTGRKKAKRSKWRVPEATLLGLAVIGGSIGAWMGMKTWHHKTLHRKFRYGVPLILICQIALLLLCSCGTASSSLSSNQTAQKDISTVADKVWVFASSHPEGFTLDIRTMTEPKQGIAVSYAATQNSHTRSQLHTVIRHALQNDGYVGGWYNQEDGLYYFDSTRLFPEDSLNQAVQFGKDNKQTSVFILSTSSEVFISSDATKHKRTFAKKENQ